MLIVDTGVLLAAADEMDRDHHPCRVLLEAEPGPLVTSPLVVAETAYLIGRQLGAAAEAVFVRAVADREISVEALTADDFRRIADLVERYIDMALGATDASLVALAERHRQRRIATLGHRHFSVVRDAEGAAFELIP